MDDEASFPRGLSFCGVRSLPHLARNVKVDFVLGGASRKHRTRNGFYLVFLPSVGLRNGQTEQNKKNMRIIRTHTNHTKHLVRIIQNIRTTQNLADVYLVYSDVPGVC